ncbi:MAG: DVU0259 family response regulator domain-containing protein [Thermodesulfobacteriota bacterium]
MSHKIMIVDDDPEIVSYLKELLEDNGYSTCVATDGNQALEIVRQEQPDLITLDLEMPDEWGPRFYRRLSQDEAYRFLPVIVISGLSGSKYAIPRAVASLNKPFDKNELLRLIAQTLH